jgi:hypothetical protein
MKRNELQVGAEQQARTNCKMRQSLAVSFLEMEIIPI